MKLHLSSYFWILITILGLIQTFRLNFVSTRDLRQANEKDIWFLKQKQDTIPAKLVHAGLRNATQMGDSAANIFYFIQVSDLHISKFQPKGHTIHFLHFLQSALPVIKPEFVVVTGDLVDAKDQTRTVSAQHPEEWQVYKSAVEQGANTTKWYDMRGNHDCFDLVDWQAENNMYKTFGESAKLLDDGKGVYSWQVSKSFGEYNFVVVDSCPKKGPSRPFNFFGYLTTNTMNRLVSKIMSNSYNHTFLFSHYPTTTMLTGKSTEGYTFGDLANHFSIYFCGHLHRLTAGLGDVLKSYSKSTDSLELELSDMKDHGSYRIIAVDHDLISFVDIDLPIDEIPPALAEETIPLTETNKIVWPKKIKPAPVILITNPKDSRFTMPSKEPLQNVRKSSHIRFLVFTEYEPTELRIKVFMDDKHHPFPAKFVGSMKDNMPLWTTLWEPNDFDDYSTHILRIEVTSPDGQTGTSQVPFRMDNMRVKIQGGVGEWVIWSNMAKLTRFLSIFAIAAMLTTLIVPKIYNDYERQQTGFIERRNLRNKILYQIHEIDLGLNRSIYASVQKQMYTWIHRFLQFPEGQPEVWYLCYVFLLGLLTLPWFRAELIPSGKNQGRSDGNFYMWGLLFENDQWIPLADTWMYAIFSLTFNCGIFILFFVWKSTSVHLLYCKGMEKTERVSLLCDRIWFQIFVLVYWVWRMKEVSELATFYGGVWPTLISNLMFWWLIVVALLIIFGKNGIVATAMSRNRNLDAEPVGISLEICPACYDSNTDAEPVDQFFVNAVTNHQESEERHIDITPQDEEARHLLVDEEGISSDSSDNTRIALRRKTSKKD